MQYHFSPAMDSLQSSAIREILKNTADPAVIPFAAGNPSQEAFPTQMIREISDELFATDPIGVLQYNITEGYIPLKDSLKAWLKEEHCFDEEKDEVIVTSGAQQGIELACKVLCGSGDTIVCESPSFVGSLNAFKSYQVNLVGVETDDEGIDVEKLEKVMQTHTVKVMYLIPNFQNPTGKTMTLARRKAVYDLAVKYQCIILEDNPYGDLRFQGENIPSIKTFDTEGVVLYMRSFSKILAPGLRVGYVSGPKEILAKMVICKQVSDVHSTIRAQRVCHQFLEKVEKSEYLSKLRTLYGRKYRLMAESIEKYFPSEIQVTHPEGGLFLRVTLPDHIDMLAFCKKAINEAKVAVVPWNAFLISDQEECHSFRMNYSTPTDEQIVQGCERLGNLIKNW